MNISRTRGLLLAGRDFTPDVFKAFMYAQSQPFPEMIDLMRGLKHQHRLQVAAVSNEGHELATYRIQQFKLGTFIDFFCFILLRPLPQARCRHVSNCIGHCPSGSGTSGLH